MYMQDKCIDRRAGSSCQLYSVRLHSLLWNRGRKRDFTVYRMQWCMVQKRNRQNSGENVTVKLFIFKETSAALS